MPIFTDVLLAVESWVHCGLLLQMSIEHSGSRLGLIQPTRSNKTWYRVQQIMPVIFVCGGVHEKETLCQLVVTDRGMSLLCTCSDIYIYIYI